MDTDGVSLSTGMLMLFAIEEGLLLLRGWLGKVDLASFWAVGRGSELLSSRTDTLRAAAVIIHSKLFQIKNYN